MRAIARPLIYASLKNSLSEVKGVENLPAKGPYIIAANHIDYLDGHRIGTALYPHRDDYINFLAQTNYYWWTGMIIKINYRDKAETLAIVKKHLRQGGVICNFPESRRNTSDTLLPGKTGTVRMALAAQVSIVPLGIIGPSGDTFTESVRLWLGSQAKYKIAIGKPLVFKKDFDHFDDQQRVVKLTQEMMAEIGKLCHKKSV